MKIVLKRVAQTKKGTFGILLADGVPLCVTLEDPWKDNARNVSCIPEGEYKLKPHNGSKFKNVWILQDVPDRSAILIHAGNTIKDTSGCILVGRSFSANGIRSSKDALNHIRGVLPSNFSINIVNCYKEKDKPCWFNVFKKEKK